MTRVLLIGIAPDAVDFNDPALPPGLDAGKIQAGLDLAMRQMTERGWEGVLCTIRPDDTALPQIERALGNQIYDCIVIGGGVRVPPRNLLLFEAIINTVHRLAPASAIVFNTKPEESADAAARWLPPPRVA